MEDTALLRLAEKTAWAEQPILRFNEDAFRTAQRFASRHYWIAIVGGMGRLPGPPNRPALRNGRSRAPLAGVRALFSGAVLGGLLVGALALQPYRLALNVTPSEPEGLYLTKRLSPDAALHRGELVVMRYEGPAVARYRTVAPYPAGSEFIKRVAGVPGDLLYSTSRRVRLVRSGAAGAVILGFRVPRSPSGKPVPAGPIWGGVRIPAGWYYLASDGYKDAFDSRYFGLVPRRRIIAEAWPLLVRRRTVGGRAQGAGQR